MKLAIAMPDFAQGLPDKNNKENIMGLYKQALDKMAEEISANVGYVRPQSMADDGRRPGHFTWDPGILESDYFTSYPGTTAPAPRSKVGEGFRGWAYRPKPGKPISMSSLEQARQVQAAKAAIKFAPLHTPLYNRLYAAFISQGRHNWEMYQNGKFAPGKSHIYFEYPELEEMEQYKALSEEQKQAIRDQYKEMVYNNNANTGYRHA